MSSVNFPIDLRPILRNQIPGQLVVQITDRCNALCPQCGMRVTERFQRSSLDFGEIRKIVDSAAARKVRAISFTGGEPLLHFARLVEMIDYAAESGIDYIRTGTNGYLFCNSDAPGFDTRVHRIAERLSRTALRNFWISIDSAVASVHERMRGFPGMIKGIERALPIFHEHGIFPSANLGINRNVGGPALAAACDPECTDEQVLEQSLPNFKHAFRRFYRFVANLGFTIVNACYPMSINTGQSEAGLEVVYGANSEERIVNFSRLEKALLFKALLQTIAEYREQIRIFSPLSSLYALYRQYRDGKMPSMYPCHGGIDFFFIDARNADTYPCGYRGSENLGKYWQMKQAVDAGTASCTRCDWECFRDPSELFGPLLAAFSRPAALLRDCMQDWNRYRLWISDIRYYKACDYFNGRRPPDPKQLARFKIDKNPGARAPSRWADRVDGMGRSDGAWAPCRRKEHYEG
jgi:MoaA/NifB/PqqE/SkfB family radical SAM enzyme